MNRLTVYVTASLAVSLLAFLAIGTGFGGATGLVVGQLLLLLAVIYLIGKGAEWMVEGSIRLARMLGVSYLMIGLTVVAFGTSAPEMAASVLAALSGSSDIAISNVIGSNIFNLCFIPANISG